jgi:arylformamidase
MAPLSVPPSLPTDCDFHAHRSATHAPGPLIPISGADHFTILEELRRPDGRLVRAVAGLKVSNSVGMAEK